MGNGVTPNSADEFKVSGNLAGHVVLGAPTSGVGPSSSNRPVRVLGNITGTLELLDGLSSSIDVSGGVSSGGSISAVGNLAQTGRIKIGNSLAGTIALPSNGLLGQILVNTNNSGGTWSGNVTLGGGAPLNSATYPTPATSLGGGSIGVVPYNLHYESCSPAYSRSANNYPHLTSCPTITLRWYGPVESASNISVWYTDWSSLDDMTSYFTIAADPTDPRQITLTPVTSSMPVGVYWVYPYTLSTTSTDYDYVLCRNSDLGGTPNIPVANDVYTIEIVSGFLRGGGDDSMMSGDFASSPCIADADCDGDITPLDITGFLELYFAANTTSATTECPGRTADANGDSAVDTADIAAFLSAWFAHCN